uniref:Uncharacterized protein n=1 Tax=Timema poppense TaxID=170557 RepID=A0A7R9H5Z3_TIMPO|nr:unnamed protein product [Timema poppensis]
MVSDVKLQCIEFPVTGRTKFESQSRAVRHEHIGDAAKGDPQMDDLSLRHLVRDVTDVDHLGRLAVLRLRGGRVGSNLRKHSLSIPSRNDSPNLLVNIITDLTRMTLHLVRVPTDAGGDVTGSPDSSGPSSGMMGRYLHPTAEKVADGRPAGTFTQKESLSQWRRLGPERNAVNQSQNDADRNSLRPQHHQFLGRRRIN